MHVSHNYLYSIGFPINIYSYKRFFYARICDMLQWRHFVPALCILWYVLKTQMLKCWFLICWAVCDMMMFYDNYDYHIKQNIFLYYIFIFWKDRGCYKKVREHMQISSTESTLYPVIQATPVNHLLNDKSDKSK